MTSSAKWHRAAMSSSPLPVSATDSSILGMGERCRSLTEEWGWRRYCYGSGCSDRGFDVSHSIIGCAAGAVTAERSVSNRNSVNSIFQQHFRQHLTEKRSSRRCAKVARVQGWPRTSIPTVLVHSLGFYNKKRQRYIRFGRCICAHAASPGPFALLRESSRSSR